MKKKINWEKRLIKKIINNKGNQAKWEKMTNWGKNN